MICAPDWIDTNPLAVPRLSILLVWKRIIDPLHVPVSQLTVNAEE
jgi:hypothetical protein